MKVFLKVELDLVFVDPDTGLADTDEEIEASDLPDLAESLQAYLKPDDDNYSSPDFLDGSGLFIGVTAAKVTLDPTAPRERSEHGTDGKEEKAR